MSDDTSRPSNPGKGRGTPKKKAASQRYADRQATRERAERAARHERNRRYALFSIALVVLIVATLVVVKVAGGGGGNGPASADQASPPAGTPVPAATLAKIASVPIATLRAAPTSGLITQLQPVKNPTLRSDGKPELLFIGAEYCPHCAAERWPLYIALSKFGTFSPQPGRIHSADQDGDVPTLTFYGTTYSSPYFTFVPVEVYTNHPSGEGYTSLQTPTAAQVKLWQESNGEDFPFLDFGGTQILPSAQYSYAPLQDLPFSEVASQAGNNSTTIGANIDASANQLVRAICDSLSGGKPDDVCSS
jgi:hypothetical protein